MSEHSPIIIATYNMHKGMSALNRKVQVESMAEQVEKERLELLLQELQNKVEENPQLKQFKDQILFEITQDGLRIQIMDAENRPMFASGSANLEPYFEDILLAMSDTIKAVPNKISISGHTDAMPYAGGGDFGNWELSANRANAARRALVAGSYPETQIARVVGYASSALFDRDKPLNPVNRRIDIIVLTKKAQRSIEGDTEDGAAGRECCITLVVADAFHATCLSVVVAELQVVEPSEALHPFLARDSPVARDRVEVLPTL